MTSSTDSAPTGQPSMATTTESEWRVATLGDCVVINDDSYSPQEAWPFINYLDTSNVTEGRVAEIQSLAMGKDTVPSRARRKVQLGDMVYSTVRPNQRHFGLIKHVPENFLASTGFAVIRGRPDVAHTEFIYWFLAQDNIVEYLQTIAENSTSAYPSIRPSALEELEISLPPLPEQRRIAQILGALDDKIELNRRTNETLEQMARALFKSWFLDFDPVRAKMDGWWRRGESLPGQPAGSYDLFPDRLVPSELGEIPERWGVSCFGDLADVVGGGTPSTKEPAYWTNGTHRFATPKDLSGLSVPILFDTERRITDEGLGRISSGLLPAGVVLMSSRAPIGYLAIAQNPVAVNQGFIAMQAKPGVSNLFLLYCTKFSEDEIISRANGSTFLEISKTNFRPIPILMPDDAIMAEFDAATKPLITRIIHNCYEIRALESQRDTLLPWLLSGESRLGGGYGTVSPERFCVADG